jgi:hypothetical protein
MLTDLEKTQILLPGEKCEFRFPARTGWRQGIVESNGGGNYWRVLDVETGDTVEGIYIEHVRALGTDPWGTR